MTSETLNEGRKSQTNFTLSTSNSTWTYSYLRLSLDFCYAKTGTDNLGYGNASKEEEVISENVRTSFKNKKRKIGKSSKTYRICG
jgi:hypothetical protein